MSLGWPSHARDEWERFPLAHKLYRDVGEIREPAMGRATSIYTPESEPLDMPHTIDTNQLLDHLRHGPTLPRSAMCLAPLKLAVLHSNSHLCGLTHGRLMIIRPMQSHDLTHSSKLWEGHFESNTSLMVPLLLMHFSVNGALDPANSVSPIGTTPMTWFDALTCSLSIRANCRTKA